MTVPQTLTSTWMFLRHRWTSTQRTRPCCVRFSPTLLKNGRLVGSPGSYLIRWIDSKPWRLNLLRNTQRVDRIIRRRLALLNVKHEKEESLRAFMERFSKVCMIIRNFMPEIAMHHLVSAIWLGRSPNVWSGDQPMILMNWGTEQQNSCR